MSKLRSLKLKLKSGEIEIDPNKSSQATRRVSKLVAIKASQPVILGETTSLSNGRSHSLFEQFKAAMETDIARLKNVPVLEDKLKLKFDLLPSYADFVTDYVNQGHDYPNNVAVRVMIWMFDVNLIEQGLNLGLYLIKTGNQQTPENFGRGLETFICDAIYDWSNVQLKAEQSASPYLDQLVDTAVNDKWDLHPAVHSKMFAMMAKHAFAQGEWQDTIALCNKAETVNPEGAGVKTLKTKAQKEIDKVTAEQNQE